jgi:hypothetical protein
MGEQQRRNQFAASAGEGACRVQRERMANDATARQHTHVPTECALCGAAEFSAVVEVKVGASRVLHWIAPPTGWYLLREARPELGAPLLHGRCPDCMARLLQLER